jgi:alkylation response protein AidB-like acyl-CoA dehydrogenase
VPKSAVLGEVGKGYKVAIETLNEGRIGIGAQMLGLASARSSTPSSTRRNASSSASRSPISRACSSRSRAPPLTRGGTAAVYNAARLRDARQPFLTEAAMCKIFSSEVAERTASLAVNLYGGYGFVKDYPVEKLYRDAKIGQIYEGTSNLQLQTIAKNLMS